MKYTIAIIISLIFSLSLIAQDSIEKSATINKSTRVKMDFRFADQIIIKTWDKNEALVKAIVNINDNNDNDKFSLKVTDTGNGVEFISEIDDLEKLSGRNTNIQQGVIVRDDDHCVHLEIDFEVFLPATAQIDLETISGNIEIIGFDSPIKAKTISGFIDVSISPQAKADISMETITGECYSNLELTFKDDPRWEHQYFGGQLEAFLNGGGETIKLETVSGNIYLRTK